MTLQFIRTHRPIDADVKHRDIYLAAFLIYPDDRSQRRRHCHEKIENAGADIMRLAIQQEIARSDESRYDHRLHGLLLVTGGHSCQQVADLFGEDRQTVQRWVTRFETHGLTGLRDGARSGRPATLNATQWAALGRDLRREPQAFRHAGHLWDGKLLSAHLRLRYGVVLGVRQC
jgi:transposase